MGEARRATQQAGDPVGLRSVALCQVAWRLTEDFKSYSQSDGYSGYDAVGKRDGVVHDGCVAHARRKLDDEAMKAQPRGDRGAAKRLARIQRIYRIEKVAREAKLTAEQRKQLRGEQAADVERALRMARCKTQPRAAADC